MSDCVHLIVLLSFDAHLVAFNAEILDQRDRRFYVCGMSRSQRCKFFVWADQVNQQAAAPKPKAPKTRFHKVIAGCLWGLFSKSTDSNKEPLHLQLCTFLEEILSGWKCGGSARLTLSADSEAAKGGFLKPSLYDEARALADFYDGVLCSREKLQDLSSDLSPEKLIVSTDETSKPSIAEIANTFYADGEIKLLEASLELLALIANHETDGIEHWFSLLCEIIGSPNKTANVRSLAKRVLKQLCGGKKDLYHSVRDHFVFGFQVKTLLHNTHNRLQTCLLLKEKARQSGPHWKTGSVVKWNTLQAGGLIGTEILVSEDCSSMQSDITTGEILDELWNVAKSRGENWRNFCSLTTLPNSHKGGSHEKEDAMFGILNTPAPVVALLWIACSLVGSNQIKAFKLIDLALSASKEKKKSPTKPNASSEEDDDDGDENTGGDARGTANDRSSWLKAEVLSPEGILLNGARKMTTDDFHAFMMQFAYRGRTAELRRVACSIASKLLRKVKPSDTGLLLGQLLGGPLCDAGQLGKNSVELLNVLQSQLRIAGQLPIQVTNAADSILFYFKKQYQAIKHDRANGEYVCIESSSGTLRKRLDLASCVHCHFNSTVSAAKEASKKTPSSRATPARASSSSQGNAAGISALNVASLPTQASRRVWLPEQVGPFSKLRLDNQKESTANDGFATFRQLKYRLVLSEVHVSINDPRGRFVKTITVYFTPRPVNDVQILKSDETKWQRCATISLTRGASRASATLPVPVVAANLKIEFTDFYERPGGSKAADGSMLLHCPRCTRVVNNAIGVCANCGEHAFQCRRCRHIDYNAIQSFLCVECGFCSAGSFNFDLVAAVASNAVAITSDKDYERANRILNTAKRLHEELREALREKLNLLLQSRKPKEQQEDTNLSSFLSSPGLRRAFQSESATLTIGSIGPDGSIEGIGRKGWAVKTIASPNPGGIRATPGPAATDRTRSLIRLAQQIRNDNGSPEQRRNGDLIIRQLGGRGGTSTEALDEESDLLNLLEGSGGGGLAGLTDAPDPLSRLLASFQTSRGRNCTTATNAAGASAIGRTSTGAAARGNGGSSGRQGQGVGSMSKKQVEAKFAKALEECELLHALLRETEREAYELASRIQAWKRLERDELAQTGRLAIGIETNEQRAPLTFSPSHCSVCSNAVAVQLLVLWLRLFQANPSGVAISEDFIELLLEENIHLSKSLVDLKRTVIREIATKSPAERSRFVLSKLSNRVRYARDISSAEILGKIIEVKDNFVLSEEYVELAMSVLQHESSL